MSQYMKVNTDRPLALVGAERAATVTNGATTGTLYVGSPTVSAASYDYAIAAGGSRVVKGSAWGIASTSIPVTVNSINTPPRQPNPSTRFWIGDTPYDEASGQGANTARTALTAYLGEVNIAERTTLTGIGNLVGTTGGTDAMIHVLYDFKGNPLAWSAIAGTTAGTANTYQNLPFVAAYEVVTPGRFFIGIIGAGTTATIQLQTSATGLQKETSVWGGTQASAWTTSSAPIAVTPPTAVGNVPVAYVY